MADGVDTSIYGDLQEPQPLNLLRMGFSAAETANAMAHARMINMEVGARQGLQEIAQQSQNPDGSINFEKMGMAAYTNPKTAPMATEFVTQMMNQRLINAEAYGKELENHRAMVDAANGILAGALAKGQRVTQKDAIGMLGLGYGEGLYDLNTVAQLASNLPPDQTNPQTGEVTNPGLHATLAQLVNTTNAGRATSDKMIGDYRDITTPGGGHQLGFASPITGWNQMGTIQPTEPTSVMDTQGGATVMPRGAAPGFEGGTPSIVPPAGVQPGTPVGMAPMVGGGAGDNVGVNHNVLEAYGVGGSPPAPSGGTSLPSAPQVAGSGVPPSPASGPTPGTGPINAQRAAAIQAAGAQGNAAANGGQPPAKGYRGSLPPMVDQYLHGQGPVAAYEHDLQGRVQVDNMSVQTINEMSRAMADFRAGRGTSAILEGARVLTTLGVPDSVVNAFLGSAGKMNSTDAALEFQKLAVPASVQAFRTAEGGSTRQTNMTFEAFEKTQPNLEMTQGAIEKMFNFAKWRASLDTKEYARWQAYRKEAMDRGWPEDMQLNSFPNEWQQRLVKSGAVNYDPSKSYRYDPLTIDVTQPAGAGNP